MTVKDLLGIIRDYNVPSDAKIIYQRIEDQYFDGIDISGMRGSDGILPPGSKATPWETIKIKGMTYYEAKSHNDKIEKGKLVIEGKYDKDSVPEYYWSDEFKNQRRPIPLDIDWVFDQYVKVNTIYYNKENNTLCITAHS